MTNQEQIDELREQIDVLQKQVYEENKKKILPFLQAHARLLWSGHCRMEVEFDSIELENQVIKLLEEAEGTCGFHHMGVDIAHMTSFRYDDGTISLTLPVGGSVFESAPKIIEIAREMGLKLDFEKCIANAMSEVSRGEKKLETLRSLKAKYLTQSMP